MADKIEIVRLDAEGNVKETLHDDFPAGWSAARTEFGKLRHGEHGTAAAAEGGCLELRVGGVSKMSTKAVEKERKKRPSTKEAGEKPKKKPAAKKKEEEPTDDDGEPKMKKQSGYMYHNAQNREAAKSEIESENPDMPAKEKNQAIMKKLADMWGKLDDAAKQKWKDDAPMLPVKPKKAKKEKKEPAEKRQSTGGKVTDKKALEERMAADGWTKEEKKREGSDHVDKYWIDPKGGKKCRSIVEVARKAYPEFLSEAAKAAPTKKKPAAQKKKKPEPQAGALDDYYLGSKKKDDKDEEMEDAPVEKPAEDAMDEDAPAEEDAMETEAPAASHAERALEAEKEDAAKRAAALKAEQAKVEETVEDDGGASAALATADHRAAEAAWDAKERESDDPRAREAWAYRAKAKPMVDAVSVNETPADSSEADKKQAELVRKTWAVAHPPLDGTKAGETIVRTEADVADENVEA